MKKLFALLTLAGIIISAPSATAHMLITYKTNIMSWEKEFYAAKKPDGTFDEPNLYSDFFDWKKIQMEVSFITPDFYLTTGKRQEFTFYDPVISVKSSDFFNTFTIDKGAYIKFNEYPEEEDEAFRGESLQWFSFRFGVTELVNPLDNIKSHGVFESYGSIDTVLLPATSQDFLTYRKENWPYNRREQRWFHSTKAFFYGSGETSISIKKIPVPEPFAPVLLFIGCASVVIARNRRKAGHEKPFEAKV